MAHHDDPERGGAVRGSPAGVPAQYYSDDEISLFDLWDVLVRRWHWIAAVCLVTVLLGLAYVLIRMPVYAYTQTIGIGNWLVIERTNVIEPAEMAEDKDGERFVDTVLRSLESPEVVAAKLKEQHIPAAVRAWRQARADIHWRPQVTANADSDGGTVMLKGEGTVEREDTLKHILVDTANRLRSEHERLLASIRQEFQVELTRARNRLEDMAQDKRVREMRLQRLDRHAALLADEIESHERLLAEAERRHEALQESNPAEAMSLVMLVNDRRTARERLGQLRVELEVELPQQRELLESEIAALDRKMEAQRGEIEARRLRLASVSPTRALSEPQRSSAPVGAGDSVIMALSVVLGGMLGVFAAFFAEFAQAANRHRREAGSAEV